MVSCHHIAAAVDPTAVAVDHCIQVLAAAAHHIDILVPAAAVHRIRVPAAVEVRTLQARATRRVQEADHGRSIQQGHYTEKVIGCRAGAAVGQEGREGREGREEVRNRYWQGVAGRVGAPTPSGVVIHEC